MGSEPDITPAMEWCWRNGVDVVLPRVINGTRRMALHIVTSYDELAPGKWGIREPKPEQPLWSDPAGISLIIVPGLAFDAQFGRLGYGGGFYDRLFASYANDKADKPLLVAAAFDLQLVPELPIEPHDRRMDRILTESLELAAYEDHGR